MQKKDFKLSSVLIIQVITALIIFLLGKLFNGPSIDGGEAEPSTIYSILSMLVNIVINIILAHGLLFNRMGSVSEYLDGFHVINPRNFALSLLINVIPTIAVIVTGTFFATSLSVSIMAGSYTGLGSMLILLIVLLIVSMIYYIFTAYQYFVIADNPDMAFGDLFKQVFKVGSDLAGATVKIFLKWILAPIIIYIVLIVAMLGSLNGPNIGATILVSILSLVFIVYIFIAYALFLNQLSLNYLDYKEKNTDETYQKQVFE